MSQAPWTRRLANAASVSGIKSSVDALFESAVAACSGALLRQKRSSATSSSSGSPHTYLCQQTRRHSALPQPQFVDQDSSEQHHSICTSPPPPPKSEDRWKWRQSLPSVHEVSQQLKRPTSSSSCGASSRGKAAAVPLREKQLEEEEAPLSWQDVVRKARDAEASGLLLNREEREILTDTFGRQHTYLRISLTERCNLRCLYCMPEEGVDLTSRDNLLSPDEIMRLTRLFAAAGVNKIRLTGGEPTLRRDLVDIVRNVASVPGIDAVGITSNGVTLGKTLPELQEAGLTQLNISLDTLRPERFEAMTRRKGHNRVLDTIRQAVELGYDPVKVNVVVVRGVNDDEIADFVELTRSAPINVRFIEYMPFDGNVWSSEKLVPLKEMMEKAGERHGGGGLHALLRCADPAGEVAKNYHIEGHRGAVSFISSMTSQFCGDCNRVRLMADGNFKVCLFGANEVSLRDAMREGASDDDLRAVVSAAVNRKKAAHAGMFELARTKNRAMVKIGG